jgi:hypothetical protein
MKENIMSQQDPVSPAAVGRLAALGGLGFAVASIAGDLVIGPFPRPATPASRLVPFYAAHHAQVLAGGMLLGLGGVLFVPFGLAVWARIRQAPGSPLLAGLAVIATTMVALTTLAGAGVYGVLGDIGGQPGISPAALQAWHIMGSDGSLADGASTFLFLLMAALAGLAARAVPRWLAWPALLLAVLSLLPGPFGFLASLGFLAWTAAAGITLLVAHQSRPQLTHATTVPAKEVRHA